MGYNRIVWFATHPIYYQVPIYRAAQKEFGDKFRVVYFSDYSVRSHVDQNLNIELSWNFEYFAGYQYKILNSWPKKITSIKIFSPIVIGLIKELINCKNSYIVAQGWNHYGMIIIYLMKWVVGYRIILRCEATDHTTSKTGVIGIIRDYIVQLALKSSFAFGSIGSINAEFYRKRGVRQGDIYEMPYCIDNSRFSVDRKVARDELSLRHGIPKHAFSFLFIGKFIARKNPNLVIKAFLEFTKDIDDAYLVMVGAGPLLKECMQITNHKNVIFCGFINQDLLPMYYAGSNVFIFPSQNENWGLVINEAIAAGCVVITSNEVGASFDLINFENGIVLDDINEKKITKALKHAYKKYKAQGLQISKADMSRWSPEANIFGLKKIMDTHV